MVRWAPLAIPLSRRAQTGALVAIMCLLPAVLIVLAVALATWTGRAALAAYLAFLALDRGTPTRGGRVLPWLRRWGLWQAAKAYFPAHLHVAPLEAAPATQPVSSGNDGAAYPPPPSPTTVPPSDRPSYDRSKPHIFCLHPHGILSLGAIANLVWDGERVEAALGLRYRVATVTFNFLLPLWRDLVLGMGFVSASRESISYLLRNGTSAVIVIGGARETLYARPGATELVLAKRMGFVKQALQHGASLVPCWSFGENELYGQVSLEGSSGLWRAVAQVQRAMIRWTGFVVPLVHGRGVFQYDFGVLPRRQALHTVMGAALPMPHIPHPTADEVAHHHARYVTALTALYDAYRDKYPPVDWKGAPLPSQPLTIVE